MEKPIPGYADYFATDDGQIISRKRAATRIKAQRLNHKGYLYVNISGVLPHTGKQGKRKVVVHHLILLAFSGAKPFAKAVARHLDGKRTNNIPGNLKWGTRRENCLDAMRHGTCSLLSLRAAGEASPVAKLKDADVIAIVGRLKTGGKPNDIAPDYNISASYVRMLGAGKGRGVVCQQL